MIRFFYSGAPNPIKVAMLLEEAEIPYEAVPVDTRKGDQFTPDFLEVNPNSKVPAIIDLDTGHTVFDSNAILLYLAEKYDKFLPENSSDLAVRGEMLSWLMFVATGIGPFSGQSVHFRHYAPEPKEYALNRYDYEAHRHWKLVDQRLSQQRYMVGASYSFVDIAIWAWARLLPYVLGDDKAFELYPNVKRLLDEVNARPAKTRVDAFLKKHTFSTSADNETLKIMFPQIKRLKEMPLMGPRP